MHPDETSRHSYPTGQFGPQEYPTTQFAPPQGFPPPVKKKKKSRVGLVVALVAVGFVVLCGGAVVASALTAPAAKKSAAAAPKAAATTPASCRHGRLGDGQCAGATAEDAAADKFLTSARTYAGSLGDDDKLVELGQAMCSALDTSAGDPSVLVNVDTSVPKKLILEIARDAATYLCPQWKDKVLAYKLPVGIEDGNWLPGVDFPVGTYETTSQSDTCYWDVTTGDGDSKHYVEQEVGPGHYRVKLKSGQKFTTQDCGTWKKIG